MTISENLQHLENKQNLLPGCSWWRWQQRTPNVINEAVVLKPWERRPSIKRRERLALICRGDAEAIERWGINRRLFSSDIGMTELGWAAYELVDLREHIVSLVTDEPARNAAWSEQSKLFDNFLVGKDEDKYGEIVPDYQMALDIQKLSPRDFFSVLAAQLAADQKLKQSGITITKDLPQGFDSALRLSYQNGYTDEQLVEITPEVAVKIRFEPLEDSKDPRPRYCVPVLLVLDPAGERKNNLQKLLAAGREQRLINYFTDTERLKKRMEAKDPLVEQTVVNLGQEATGIYFPGVKEAAAAVTEIGGGRISDLIVVGENVTFGLDQTFQITLTRCDRLWMTTLTAMANYQQERKQIRSTYVHDRVDAIVDSAVSGAKYSAPLLVADPLKPVTYQLPHWFKCTAAERKTGPRLINDSLAELIPDVFKPEILADGTKLYRNDVLTYEDIDGWVWYGELQMDKGRPVGYRISVWNGRKG